MPEIEFVTGSPEETVKLGSIIGALLRPGCFLALQGELGGGKTCFTRGVVASAAPESAHLVSSPTFAIMNHYPGTLPVYHFDFYRMTGVDDILEQGFEDYFEGDGICIAEWAERIASIIPDGHIKITFKQDKQERRRISVTSAGTFAESVLSILSEHHDFKKNL